MSTFPAEKLVLNLQEASDLLGLRPAALYELTRTRARARQRIPIPYLRLGGRRLAFRRESLERWVAQLEDAAPICNVLLGGAR